MIFFYCPQCNEDLEADDEIKGAKMKCPACWKEIDVPEVGLKVEEKPRKRRSESYYRLRESGGASQDQGFAGLTMKFVGVVLLISVVVLGTLFGIGMYLHEQQQVDNRLDCGTCVGRGQVQCKKCGGREREACANCEGRGKIVNFRGETESCTSCSGTGNVPCQVCGGNGEYDCSNCRGSGKIGEASRSP